MQLLVFMAQKALSFRNVVGVALACTWVGLPRTCWLRSPPWALVGRQPHPATIKSCYLTSSDFIRFISNLVFDICDESLNRVGPIAHSLDATVRKVHLVLA